MLTLPKDQIPTRFHIDNQMGVLTIQFADGLERTLAIQDLRGSCPCALCQEHQAQTRFIPNQTHQIAKAAWVGQYAVNLQFSDGHTTGIFRFDHLRNLEPLKREEADARSSL